MKLDDLRPGVNQAIIGARISETEQLGLGYALGESGIRPGELRRKDREASVHSGKTADGEWHHLAASISMEETRLLYLDGEVVGTGPGGGVLMGEAPLFIGSQGKEGLFRGLIDEVRIYERVLGPVELEKVFNRHHP